jgi:hypothetical protein
MGRIGPKKLRYITFGDAKSAFLKQQKHIQKPPQNNPQHPNDTKPPEAEIPCFRGCKISITKSSEMNSKTTLEPYTAPR